MTPQELRQRTQRFAVDVIRFCRTLPRSDEGKTIGRQLLRAGTGAGSHYRAACRARSDAEFIAKMGTAIEEADEAGFWLEVLVEAEVVRGDVTKRLYREADELTRIFVASRETTRRKVRLRASRRRVQEGLIHKSQIANRK